MPLAPQRAATPDIPGSQPGRQPGRQPGLFSGRLAAGSSSLAVAALAATAALLAPIASAAPGSSPGSSDSVGSGGGSTSAAAPGVGAPVDTSMPPVGDALTWAECEPESAEEAEEYSLPRPDVLCSSVPIPVDHADPDGRTVDVEVRRITATGARTGTVFGNPGGPGGDARTLWYSAIDAEGDSPMDSLRSTNDLVIVQPRGLEGSGALECAPDETEVPSNPLRAKMCMDADPELVSSFTTENLVRDHEYVRRAMGLDRITFYGYSYGTAIGMVYQTLFPGSIHRMVLDSSVGPTDTWWYESHQLQAENRYQARNYVLEWIAEHDATYGLGDTPLKVYQQIHELDLSEGSAAARFLPPPAQEGDTVAGSLPVGSAGGSAGGSADALETGSVRLDNFAAASSGAFDEDVEGAVGYFQILDAQSRHPDTWSEIAWVISAKIHGTVSRAASPAELAELIEEDSPHPLLSSDMNTYLTILNCNETAPPAGSPFAEQMLGSSDSAGSTTEEAWALEEQTEYCLYPPSAVPPKIQPNEMEAQPLILQSDHDPNTPGLHGPTTAAATGGTLVRIKGTVHCHFDTGNDAVDAVVLNYLRTGEIPEGLYLDTPRPSPGPAPWA